MLSSRGYQTIDARFRSPVVPRKTVATQDVAKNLVKNSRRSKSSENSLKLNDPFLRTGDINGAEIQDPMIALSKRWSIIAKNQESMSKQELLNNYRLLMNDHLRLERFLSIVTKDSEVARNRLETDLLDAMMCIEDLKQALEVRMARRRKIDPREAEERRALIRQNKKLLNQLYESARKIELLELTKLEMKEQLELLDFQMMEVENQKAMVEDELRRQTVCENRESQTEESIETGPSAVAQARAEAAEVLADLVNLQAEKSALSAKLRHLENLVRDLRRDNSELREHLTRNEEDSENSLVESDKHILQTELAAKTAEVKRLEKLLNKSQAVHESGQLAEAKSSDTHSIANDDTSEGDKKGFSQSAADKLPETDSLILGAKVVQQLAGEIGSPDGVLTEEGLLSAIRNLKRLRDSLLVSGSQTNMRNNNTPELNSPEYYSNQLSQLQTAKEADNLRAQLAVSERRRVDLENRLTELTADLTRANSANHSNEAALTASRRNEAALRRRLLASMDTGSTSQRGQRPISSVDFAQGCTASPSLKEELDVKIKVIQLEAANLALSEASQLDRARLLEQATRIAQLEAEHRTLHDRMANLQASEGCALRSSIRLQALYEDMLREFAESLTHEASRRRQRPAPDGRGYDTDTALLSNPTARPSTEDSPLPKACSSKDCSEVRRLLAALQERFIRTADQLTEAETLLAEVGSNGSDPGVLRRSPPSPPPLIAALRALRPFQDCGVENNEMASRLLTRLERWIQAQLGRHEIIEAQLRQRCVELQVSLAKNDEDGLTTSLDAQNRELADLYRKLEQTQGELELVKSLCPEQYPGDHFDGARIDIIETI